MMRNSLLAMSLAVALTGAGCGDDSGMMMGTDGGGMGTDGGGVGTDGGGIGTDGGGTSSCPAIAERTVVTIDADITTNTTWSCQNLYRIDAEVYVVGATLTIQAGTVVQGTSGPNALIVTTTGMIDAEGTAADPIVFTSANPEGTREPGNWGGVVLLGLAPINVPGGTNNVEGLDPGETRGSYGGSDATHNCGTLRYVRIEFAGYVFGMDNELNGLTMGGCGSGTTIEYVQSHRGLDDGIEIFGGAVDVKHVIVSQGGDDGLDWDEGWVGRAQFVVCQEDNGSDRCFEADNREEERDASPRSDPTIWNATLIGRNGATQEGMRLRHGTAGDIHNVVVQDFTGAACVRVDGSPTLLQANAGDLMVADSVLDHCGPTATPTFFEFTADEGDTTTMFTGDWDAMNMEGTDALLGDPSNLDAPDFAPGSGSPVGEAGAVPPAGGFFDMTATYAGAFAPGGTDWTAGWTAFPAD